MRAHGWKTVGVIGALAIVGPITTACTSTASTAGAGSASITNYHVGANLCLSGAAGTLGQQMLDGMQLAATTINSANHGYKITIDADDSAADPQKGVTAFTDLTQNKKDPLVFTCGTTVIQATLPLAQRDKVMMLNTSAGGPNLIGSSPWLYNDFINTELEAKTMADYMYNTLNYRRVAVNYRSDAYGLTTFNYFKSYWAQLGGTITVSVVHDINSPNQDTQIAKIRSVASRTDAIYLMTADKDAGTFIKGARQQGITTPIVGLGGVFSPAMLSIAGPAANGIIYTSPSYNLTGNSPEVAAFSNAYAAKYGSTSPNTYLVSYYDGMLLVNDLIQYLRAHKLPYDGSSLRQAASAGSYTGLGHTIQFDARNTTTVPVILNKVVNGKATPVTG